MHTDPNTSPAPGASGTRSMATRLWSPWIIALAVLLIFLATNRYYYGWDDQHLEIPLLKHLIDPELYAGDYYVESLAANFSSYLFPLLSKVISVRQIPAAYLALYLISRYFLFFWTYKLWLWISKSPPTALACTLSFFLIGRTEEFLYRTFSHQEFAYIGIFAGIYFFYRERYLLAAILFGISANFHALYSLFPMFYMSCYLLFAPQERRWPKFFGTGLIFVAGALPFLWWAIPSAIQKRSHMDPSVMSNWVEMYIISCPQNFLFYKTPLNELFQNPAATLESLAPYISLMLLWALLTAYFKPFRADGKAHAVSGGALFLLGVSFIFTYIHPSRFFLDLNLIRNTQYWQYLLVGYVTYMLCDTLCKKQHYKAALLLFVWMGLCMGPVFTSVTALLVAGCWWMDERLSRVAGRWTVIRWSCVVLIPILLWFLRDLIGVSSSKLIWFAMPLAFGILVLMSVDIFKQGVSRWLAGIVVGASLLGLFGYYVKLHTIFVQVSTKGGGFWQLQRNWEDMQLYVRDHTPKQAKLLVPYNMEMGGFRIRSDRSIVVSERDHGIIGFDYRAVLEWQERMNDVAAFKVFTEGNLGDAIKNGLVKYKVDYIVFMRYYQPGNNDLFEKMYENEVFALYRVKRKF